MNRRRYTEGPDGAKWIGVHGDDAEWERLKRTLWPMGASNNRHLRAAFCVANQDDHFDHDYDAVGYLVTLACNRFGEPRRVRDLIESLASVCSEERLIDKSASNECMGAVVRASCAGSETRDGHSQITPLVPYGTADAVAAECGISFDQAKEFGGPAEIMRGGPRQMRLVVESARLCALNQHRDPDTPTGNAISCFCLWHDGDSRFNTVFSAATDAGFTVDEATCMARRSTATS
nr:hypothetical protein [Pandoravirus massiliensis]